MTDRLHLNSDSPLSKAHIRGRVQYSFQGEEGRGHIPQQRIESADDMAHYGVPAELLEFCDEFFPQRTSADKPKPKLDGNPFAALENADKLSERTVRAAFVCISSFKFHGYVTDSGFLFPDCCRQ